MDRNQAESIVQRTLSHSDAEETEVLLSHGVENLTRFSDNAISQNVARTLSTLTVKVHLGRKVGRATTDQFNDESLKRAIDMAKKIAEQQKDDPELLPLAGASEFAEIRAYYENTAAYSPEERAAAIASLVAEITDHNASSAGIFATEAESIALGNSNGLFGYYRSTSATLSATVEANGVSGWAEEIHRDVSKIDVSIVARTALRKALDARNPIPIDPGEYTVVLEPAAVADLLMFMGYEGFGGLNYVEGRSFVSNKIGQKILGENVTIVDDAYSELNPGLPFDFEGQPRQRLVLIEKGVARNVVHDRLTAARAGTTTTGHSLPQPNSSGPLPFNLMLEPGNSSLKEMIESTEKGILVTHFHYTNVIDPIRLTLTGMTRDGTFLIENGRITKPVRNMRFTDSIVDAFNQIELISKDRKTAEAFFAGSYVVPALKISKFNFSSASEF